MVIIPRSAYATPSQDELDNNRTYWDGYANGAMKTPPDVTGSVDYWDYRDNKVKPLMLDPYNHFLWFKWVNTKNVGDNAAFLDGANYEYHNDPNSPFKKVV